MRDPERSREMASEVPERLLAAGGLLPGVARGVAAETGVAEAAIHGVGSFFHLLADPHIKVRICTGLSCLMKGSDKLLAAAQAAGLPAEGCSCLAACDAAPAALRERTVLPNLTAEAVAQAAGTWEKLVSPRAPKNERWFGAVGPTGADPEKLAVNLPGAPHYEAAAFARAEKQGVDWVLDELEAAGLQGRGGAGFPSHVKWRAVRKAAGAVRYVVLNADEGEPGTFKDREVMLRRPDLVLEGLAIAAKAVGARDIYLYLRGEFTHPWKALEEALAEFTRRGAFAGLHFHFHSGHGAYICGEETALLEALEGKRGMPRLKPPFPTDHGLWGQPTLIHNVETIACVPAIMRRGGKWFHGLGRTGPGTTLYCVSGHVKTPGVYEMPLGICLDELVEAAGGYDGTLQAFSPGGASSGFLPASERTRPLDYKHLAEVGSMLGSRGAVVLNETVDMAWAVRAQLAFFEAESCGQCAPCRIGTRFLRESLDRHIEVESPDAGHLKHVAEAAWEMNEGSICGLGQAAPLPLTTALRYFPEAFAR